MIPTAKKSSVRQIVMRNVFLILLLVFFVQLVAIVYAMSLTLFSTSTEDKDTYQIIMTDFDSDGDIDYVAGNSDGGDIFHFDYYVNNGSASFSTSTFGTSASFGTGMANDIDGDGDADIISANGTALYKYSNNGSGVFTRTTIASGLAQVMGNIVTADLDGDGDIDFVGGSPNNAQVNAVYLNDGHGNFSAATSTIPSIADLCVADLTSDGIVDLAFNKGDDTMRVFRNSGTGAFIQISSVTRSFMSIPIACGDIDSDGDIDVVGTDLTGIVPFINNGAGTFTVGTTVSSGIDNPNDVDLADLDNDGDLDTIVSGDNSTGTSGAEIFINNGSAVFVSQGTPPNNNDGTKSVAIGDLDADGDLDYIRGNIDATVAGNGEPNRVYKNDQAATSANTAPTAPNTFSTDYSLNNLVSTLVSSGDVGNYNSVAIGTDGFPVMSFYDTTGEDLKVFKCGNVSCSSGNTSVTIDSTGSVGAYNSLAIGTDGFPVIAYLDGTNSYLKVAKCADIGCSSGTTLQSVFGVGVGGNAFPSIAIGADNNPIISYKLYQASNTYLMVAHCGDTSCSSGNVSTVLSAGTVGNLALYSSIKIGNDNLPIISASNGGLTVIKCGNAACSSGNTTTSVDTVGLYNALKVPADGKPFISYYDSTNGDLKVVKCGDASCASGNTISTLDATGDVGQFTSVTLGADGFPVIAYYDVTNGNLKILDCSSATCASNTTITAVDTVGDVGRKTSIALVSSSLPIATYYDVTNGDFKFLKCSQADCSAGGTNGLPNIRLSWGSGSDTETATRLLQYQLKLGTGSNANNYVSGVTASPNWVNRMMPNGQSKTYLLKNLLCRTGLTYYWSVGTVDTGFKKTASAEQTFTLDSSCNFTAGGGGSSGGTSGGSTGGSTGGGISARFFDRSGGLAATPDSVSAPVSPYIIVSVFNDLSGDGIKNGREDSRFKGLALTASGRTVDGIIANKTLIISDSGQVRFTLPASDSRGYWISANTGSATVQGYEPTTRTLTGAYVMTWSDKANASFGFRRTGLLRYQPCLSVGALSEDEKSGTDAEVLLQRLQDSFGKKVSRGFQTTQELISRKEFFTLLSLTQCIEQITDSTILEKKLRDIAKQLNMVFPLIDLALSPQTYDSLTIHSLLAAGTDVGRKTSIGDAADLSSPITREEAMRAIESVLHIPTDKKYVTGVLPKDLSSDDMLAPTFLRLQSLGILPGSFQPIVGPSQGLNKQEAALLLARAAFRGGKVFLHAEPVDKKKLKKAATTPTFLAGFPTVKVRGCLEKNPERPENVSFTDILPGDPLYPDLRDMLAYGTKNTAKFTLWLFPVTRRPTEFGVIRGQTVAALSEPVSLLETVRDLLVFACLPPPTAMDVMSGKDALRNRQGTAESRVPIDRISGLPRDSSFSSRVLYRAQDHQKEFDLSLFKFTPEFLRNPIRSPASGLSVHEASRLLASGLLMVQVKSKSMTILEAENTMEALTAAIRKDLIGTDTDWRNEPALRTMPFTRGMLLQFLATVTTARTSISTVPPASIVPIGEIWWERVK